MTAKCPTCHRDHALFYWVETSGKRVLSYICDRVPKTTLTGQIHHSTSRQAATEQIKDLPIEERWSAGYAKKQRQQKQQQLILMKQ